MDKEVFSVLSDFAGMICMTVAFASLWWVMSL